MVARGRGRRSGQRAVSEGRVAFGWTCRSDAPAPITAVCLRCCQQHSGPPFARQGSSAFHGAVGDPAGALVARSAHGRVSPAAQRSQVRDARAAVLGLCCTRPPGTPASFVWGAGYPATFSKLQQRRFHGCRHRCRRLPCSHQHIATPSPFLPRRCTAQFLRSLPQRFGLKRSWYQRRAAHWPYRTSPSGPASPKPSSAFEGRRPAAMGGFLGFNFDLEDQLVFYGSYHK